MPDTATDILTSDLDAHGVLRLTLDDVGRRNALSEAMLTRLAAAFAEASEPAPAFFRCERDFEDFGAFAAYASLDMDYGNGLIHYSMYVIATIALCLIMGVNLLQFEAGQPQDSEPAAPAAAGSPP